MRASMTRALVTLFAAARMPVRIPSRSPRVCCCAPFRAASDESAPPLTPRGVSEAQKKVIAYRQQYKCAGCACLLPPTYEVDHITPLALGGTNGLGNLQALCSACHVQKTRDQRSAILEARASRLEVPTRKDPVVEALKANMRAHGGAQLDAQMDSGAEAAATAAMHEGGEVPAAASGSGNHEVHESIYSSSRSRGSQKRN